MRFAPLVDEAEGVGEGALIPAGVLALRCDMVVVEGVDARGKVWVGVVQRLAKESHGRGESGHSRRDVRERGSE